MKYVVSLNQPEIFDSKLSSDWIMKNVSISVSSFISIHAFCMYGTWQTILKSLVCEKKLAPS